MLWKECHALWPRLYVTANATWWWKFLCSGIGHKHSFFLPRSSSQNYWARKKAKAIQIGKNWEEGREMVSISGSKGLALHLQLLLSPVAPSVYFGPIWVLLWSLVTPASSLLDLWVNLLAVLFFLGFLLSNTQLLTFPESLYLQDEWTFHILENFAHISVHYTLPLLSDWFFF